MGSDEYYKHCTRRFSNSRRIYSLHHVSSRDPSSLGSNCFSNNNVFVGWGLYKLVINKVVDRDLFISILATFGIAIVFQQLMNFIFGADVVVAQSGYGTTMLFDNCYFTSLNNIFCCNKCFIRYRSGYLHEEIKAWKSYPSNRTKCKSSKNFRS